MAAARDAWTTYDRPVTAETREQYYQLLWALHDGTAFDRNWQRRGVLRDHRVYRNMRLLVKHTGAVGDFYASKVYMGALPQDGRKMPDGSSGAIPLVPDPLLSEQQADQLLDAIAELWRRWNWQQGMSHRPRWASVLGDCLTELVDDPERHTVWPRLVWPGYVVDIELDHVDNVKYYALEYLVTLERDGHADTFRYRKEVDGDEFRYYRDDRPWADHSEGGHGDAVQPNPYGFVPAIWDRFRQVPNSVRGQSAFATTLQAVLELNSVLSHSIDYQRKAFAAPVLIKGGMGTRQQQTVGPGRDTDPAKLAEELNIMQVGENAGVEHLQFDIGQTLAQLELIKNNILEENPEAAFYHELRQMSSMTGPAVRQAMGDVITRVETARYAMDPQTIKLFQMAVAMSGYRLNEGAWLNPKRRDDVFRPFNLESYDAGDLDFVIGQRDVIPDNLEDRLRQAKMREELRFADSFVDLGEDEADAAAIIAEREKAELRRVNVY